MNTIEIRKQFGDEVDTIEESIENYMRWKQGDSECDYRNDIADEDEDAYEFYENFIKQCVVEDINKLRELVATKLKGISKPKRKPCVVHPHIIKISKRRPKLYARLINAADAYLKDFFINVDLELTELEKQVLFIEGLSNAPFWKEKGSLDCSDTDSIKQSLLNHFLELRDVIRVDENE